MIQLPDTRLILPRSDGGSVRVSIVPFDDRYFVEMGRYDAQMQRRACVNVLREELDRVVETYALCRRLLLGATDARAEALRLQEAAGLPSRKGDR